jgi:hypothetical protein
MGKDDAEQPGAPEETAVAIARLLEQETPWTPEERAAIITELRRQCPGERLYPVQRGNLANEWENMADAALLRDEYCRDIGSDIPPNLAALVAAVRRTRLTRFYPFTGHEYLYFADGPGVWDGERVIAPVRVGNCAEGYVVLQDAVGSRAPGLRATCAITTHDPAAAAAEADRLLAGWAWTSQGS